MDKSYVAYLESLSSHWSSHRAARMLTPELLVYIEPRLHRCSNPIKIRTILSLLYLPDEVRMASKTLLLRMLSEAEVDKDEWVRKLARLVSTFVHNGSIDVRETDSESCYKIIESLNANEHLQHKPPLDIHDMVNVVNEFMFTRENVSAADHNDEQEDEDELALWTEDDDDDDDGGKGGYDGEGADTPLQEGRPEKSQFQDLDSAWWERVRLTECAFNSNAFTPAPSVLCLANQLCHRGDIRMREALNAGSTI